MGRLKMGQNNFLPKSGLICRCFPTCPIEIWRCSCRRLGSGFRTGLGGGSLSAAPASLSSVLYTLPGLLGSFIATCKIESIVESLAYS